MTQTDTYHREILLGDVLDKLKEIPNDTFDCIISSPPYWALRDYSVEGQWGLEESYEEYLEKMKLLMSQLKRILKGTGTCWINLGDTYASGGGKGVEQTIGNNGTTKEQDYSPKAKYRKTMAKSRMGIPERFYINCIDSNWIARNDIPWIKWNAMPMSVKDRFTNKWEHLYFFSKAQKYYFNLDAVRIKASNDWKSFSIHVRDHVNGKAQSKFGDMARVPTEEELVKYNPDGTKKIEEKYDDNTNVARLHKDRKQDYTLGADGKPKGNYAGFNERWNNKAQDQYTKRILESRNSGAGHDNPLGNPKGKNPGDLFFENYSDQEILEWIKLCRDDGTAWELAPPNLFFINPRPMPEAHFATFPIALPQRILKCACPNKVCIKCGVPKIPISKPTAEYQKVLDSIEKWERGGMEKGLQNYKKGLGTLNAQHEIVGYDTCNCNDEFIPGIVLDPFFGSGTTGVAAELEGLRWCGIELKEEYCTIARKRLEMYTRQGALVV